MPHIYYRSSNWSTATHLRYTECLLFRWTGPVKVHGVFPSSPRVSASARTVQLHRDQGGDSEEVVTPFMHVGTYPTRNFATLGPSELRPPFAGASHRGVNLSASPSGTGQVSVPILRPKTLQGLVFLVNSRSLLFSDTSLRIKVTLNSYWGTPSSEGTELICRVPSPWFTRAPMCFPLVHLCRFAVRSLTHSPICLAPSL